jgi:hypothetical protein
VRRVPILLYAVLVGLCAASAARAEDKGAWLGLIAGPAVSAETLLAADMASLFPQGADLRVLPMLGDSGSGNLALLLDDPGIGLAFVSTEALAEASAKDKRLADRLELVARLAPQEVHVLARAEVETLSDLSGKKVSVGPAGSASAVTATTLFKALGVDVEISNLDTPGAIEQLKQGALSAVVIVDAKPSPLIGAIPINIGLSANPAQGQRLRQPDPVGQRGGDGRHRHGARRGEDEARQESAGRDRQVRFGGVPALRRVAGASPQMARGQSRGEPSRNQARGRRRRMACRANQARGEADGGKRLGSNPVYARSQQRPAGGIVQAVYPMAARQGALMSRSRGKRGTERGS